MQVGICLLMFVNFEILDRGLEQQVIFLCKILIIIKKTNFSTINNYLADSERMFVSISTLQNPDQNVKKFNMNEMANFPEYTWKIASLRHLAAQLGV